MRKQFGAMVVVGDHSQNNYNNINLLVLYSLTNYSNLNTFM